VNVGFGVGATILLIGGSVAIWSSLGSQAAARERRALFERRTRIERLLGALQDAETGQRGFLLTGDSVFLEPYDAVVSSFPGRLAAIRLDMVGFPDRAARMDTLAAVVKQLTVGLAETIELRRTGRGAEAVRQVQRGDAKRDMDQARSLVASLIRDETTLLDLWDTRLKSADQISFLTSGAGALLTVIFLLLGLRATNRNIVARERAESAVRESEQRLIRLVEALPVAVYVIDAEGKPFYTNREAQKILGQAIDPGIHARDIPRVYAAYVAGTEQLYPADRLPSLRALGGESVHVEDIVIRRPERNIPLEVWAAPVYGSDGRVAFAVAVFNDIHERQQARQAIRALNDELSRRIVALEEANRELDAFSYSISHDLRAPLRHVDGFSRLLEESLASRDTSQSQHYLKRIRDGARSMGVLIDDLLQLSRLGRQEPMLQKSDLNAIVRSVIYDLRDETKDRDVEWQVERLPAVECDPRLIKQVFVNLVSNALKFSRGRPRSVIQIAQTTADGGIPAMFVRDNGVGFDMRYAEKLFGVFQRLHLTEEFEGSGVGLALVHRIVRRHGGRIWAQAELDKGATFYFTLGAPSGNGKERDDVQPG
jgi:PAS domain S-box-containing protein